jgi:hypothetical protein
VSPGISAMWARQQIFAGWLESGRFGGSLWFIRWLGPVFRVGRDPAVSLFLGRKIPDMRDGAISSTYGNGPTTVLDHFRVKFGFLAHPKNTRLQENGSIPNSAATIQTEHYQKADRRACGTHRWGAGIRGQSCAGRSAPAHGRRRRHGGCMTSPRQTKPPSGYPQHIHRLKSRNMGSPTAACCARIHRLPGRLTKPFSNRCEAVRK